MTDGALSWVATARQLAVRGLGWLEAARHHFALPANVSSDRLHPNEDIKPLSELLLVACIALREGSLSTRETQLASALVGFAWAQLRDGEVLYELQREQPIETYPLETYVWLARCGYRHPRLDQLAAQLNRLRAGQVLEVIPNRALAVFNTERQLGLPPRVDPAVLTARTWLGGTPEPWAIDFLTFYGMTHTVFHLTDWGACPDGLPRHLQRYLHAWLPAWLEVYLEAGEWDLVSELLIVALCLSEPDDHPHAWDALARAQLPDGLLPARPGPVPTNAAKTFRDHYHPTVVAAVAGILAVSRHISAQAATR
jgi:hypothetical protein